MVSFKDSCTYVICRFYWDRNPLSQTLDKDTKNLFHRTVCSMKYYSNAQSFCNRGCCDRGNPVGC